LQVLLRPKRPSYCVFADERERVHVANDGLQALEIAGQVKPVACFLDIGMPGLDGYQLAKRLKAAPNGSGIFLVATTGWGKPEDIRRSEEAGFDLHITKPLEVTRASQALANRIRKSSQA
jgi:CheY-like chemotaxis protein